MTRSRKFSWFQCYVIYASVLYLSKVTSFWLKGAKINAFCVCRVLRAKWISALLAVSFWCCTRSVSVLSFVWAGKMSKYTSKYSDLHSSTYVTIPPGSSTVIGAPNAFPRIPSLSKQPFPQWCLQCWSPLLISPYLLYMLMCHALGRLLSSPCKVKPYQGQRIPSSQYLSGSGWTRSWFMVMSLTLR